MSIIIENNILTRDIINPVQERIYFYFLLLEITIMNLIYSKSFNPVNLIIYCFFEH